MTQPKILNYFYDMTFDLLYKLHKVSSDNIPIFNRNEYNLLIILNNFNNLLLSQDKRQVIIPGMVLNSLKWLEQMAALKSAERTIGCKVTILTPNPEDVSEYKSVKIKLKKFNHFVFELKKNVELQQQEEMSQDEIALDFSDDEEVISIQKKIMNGGISSLSHCIFEIEGCSRGFLERFLIDMLEDFVEQNPEFLTVALRFINNLRISLVKNNIGYSQSLIDTLQGFYNKRFTLKSLCVDHIVTHTSFFKPDKIQTVANDVWTSERLLEETTPPQEIPQPQMPYMQK